MILDIDRADSVTGIIEAIAWFDIRKLYKDLKNGHETDSSNFWHISDCLLKSTSSRLLLRLTDFIDKWRASCISNDLKIMGYHCTRIHDLKIFMEKGIIPLDDGIIDSFFLMLNFAFPSFLLSQGQKEEIIHLINNDSTWKYRRSKGSGPYFFLSYHNASKRDNSFHASGTEIWWLFCDILIKYCQDRLIVLPWSDRNECRELIAEKLRPFIIHCAIPFAILPAENYYIFC